MKKQIFKLGVPISGFLWIIFFNDQLLMKENIIPISIFMCQFINVVLAFAGFIKVLTNIREEASNRVNILAYGYFLISFFMLFNMYLYIAANKQLPISINYYQNRLVVQVLECILIYSVLNRTSEKQHIKKWQVMLGGLVIGGLSIAFNPMGLKREIVQGVYKGIYYLMIGLMIIGLYRSKYYRIYGVEFNNMKSAMLFKIIYLISVISSVMYFNSLWMLIVYGIDVVHHAFIYRFVYKENMKRFWTPVDQRLNSTRSELEKEELEKHNLIFASYALNKYVEVIDNEATLLKRKMEKSCGERSLLHVEKIKKNCRRLTKLSNNILDLCQMDIGNVMHHYKVTNMNQLIEVLVESILPYIESRGLQIEIKQSQDPIYCLVDTDEIERLFLNLISNAIKYSKSNGKITIYTNVKQERAYICIEDTGIGIPKEKLENIFERFERVETGFSRGQEGSGLGLAIVKSIAEIHQGTINICSEEGKGTRVSLSLPTHESQKNRTLELRSKTMLKRKIEVEFADLKK